MQKYQSPFCTIRNGYSGLTFDTSTQNRLAGCTRKHLYQRNAKISDVSHWTVNLPVLCLIARPVEAFFMAFLDWIRHEFSRDGSISFPAEAE
jgi:hypothetical protein